MIDTSLPLTDVHRHLDGNIRAQTILDLGSSVQFNAPSTNVGNADPSCAKLTSTEPDLVSFYPSSTGA